MFANNLRKAREASGLTQAGLASRLGISRTKISAWEIRRSEPDIETLTRLAETLDISADELLGIPLRQSLRQLPQPETELMKQLIRLYPEQLAIIRNLVKTIIEENEGIKA